MDVTDYQEQIRELVAENEELKRQIGHQRRVEESLLKSEAHYRMLTENAPDVLWRLDGDYRVTYISPSDERLRGYPSHEVIGHHIAELFSEEGLAQVRKLGAERREAEQNGVRMGVVTFEAQHRCKWGGWIWAEISSTPEFYFSQSTVTPSFVVDRSGSARSSGTASSSSSTTGLKMVKFSPGM